ncbi:MAG: hypothetical protein WAR24_12045, partial [Candidatus Acidiferrales bacterium]
MKPRGHQICEAQSRQERIDEPLILRAIFSFATETSVASPLRDLVEFPSFFFEFVRLIENVLPEHIRIGKGLVALL